MLGKIKSLISPFARGKKYSKLIKVKFFIVSYALLVCLLLILYAVSLPPSTNELIPETLSEEEILKTEYAYENDNQVPQENLPSPTLAPTSPPPELTQTPTPTIVISAIEPKKASAEQIDETTWSVRVEPDSGMGNAQEIFSALNSYRQKRGAGTLSLDSKLQNFAQSRADLFSQRGSLDGHAGFNDFMNNGGFEITGFNGLGENSAFMAGPLSALNIIESLFAADAPHNDNQLNPSWTHVGIGLNGNAVNINFGRR